MRVHQMAYGMMMGDAISNHVLEIDARLRQRGHATFIYAQYVAPELVGRVRPDYEFTSYLQAQADLLIYHYSIYTPNIRLMQAKQGRKMLVYHNITPPEFFYPWDATLAAQCLVGRQMLKTLAHCDWAVGDSEFNRQELIAAGFSPQKTSVLPIFIAEPALKQPALTSPLAQTLRASAVKNWLTVGRVVPNKALEDVVRLFYVYQRCINPHAHLYIVGSSYISTYEAQLAALVRALNLQQFVTLTGRITDEELWTYYQCADLYVSASWHEGFCVPLLESMRFGVPILARKATAIPDTLAQAGVLFTELGYPLVAEMAHIMLTDSAVRAQIVRTQSARLAELSPTRTEEALWQVLEKIGN